MPIIAMKGLQTLTSSTSAYDMTIRSMSSKASSSTNSPASNDLDKPISSMRGTLCDATPRVRILVADRTISLDNTRQISLIRIKCLIGPSK